MKTLYLFFLYLLSMESLAFFDLGTPNKSCPNGQMTVSFTTDETFTPGLSTFICLVSDHTGNFSAAQSVAATLLGNSFVVPALPSGLAAGTNYRIKIQANNPSVLSTQSAFFEVVSLPNTPQISPFYTSTSPLEVCVNTPTTYNISNIQSDVSYKWGWDFGFTGQVGTSLTRNNNLGGNFQYWVEAYKTGTESVCEGVRSDYTYVNVSDLDPFAQITPNSAISQCPGGDVRLEYSPQFGAETYTYQWLEGGLAIIGETNPALSPLTSGNYALQIARAGCFGTSTAVSVTFVGTPISANFVIPLVNGISCLNTTLTANTQAGASYEWFRYGSSVLLGQAFTPTQVYQSGDYTLKVTRDMCVASANFKIIPPPEEVLFYSTLNNEPAGTPIDLVVDILNVEAGNWAYQISDCATTLYSESNRNNVGLFSVTPTMTSQVYYLTNISNACGTTTQTKTLTISTTAPPLLTLPGLIAACPSLRLFTASSSIEAASGIAPGARVRFESGGGIELRPGFRVDGGVFEARVTP